MSRSFLPLILSTSAQIFSVVRNAWPHLMEQFKAGLIENGLIEGQNITIDHRFAEGDTSGNDFFRDPPANVGSCSTG